MMKKILFGMLVFALLAPFANATLQVTAFTCAGQTGTINVQSGGTMTCQATINNPDSNTASVNSVSLLPRGSWTESSSYSASGFSTTINSGASTTATFNDIRPTSSGLNNFDSVLMDSVSDTFAADTTINVVDFKSLTTSTSSSSASTGATVTVFGNVLVGGNLDVTLVVSLSGCTLKSGEASSKSLGSLSHNSASSASWQLTMGSSACSYTVTATGTKGSVTISTSKSGSITNPGSGDSGSPGGGSSSSSSGGGGGSSNATTTTTASTTATTLRKGEAVASGSATEPLVFRLKDENISLTEIIVKTLNQVTNAKITASLVQEPSTPAHNETAIVYKYVKIEKENLKDSDISEVTLIFTVENSWFSANSVDSDLVVLKRLENGWKDLPTSRLDNSKPAFVKWDIQIKTGYEAKSPGLSVFAIVAGKTPEKVKEPLDILVTLVLVTAFIAAAAALFIRHHHTL